MRAVEPTRREFLADVSKAVSGGWLALQLPWLAALSGCEHRNAATDGDLARLSPAEARTMRAFAAQIIPSGDGSPGAEEAGAVQFIDRALGMPLFADSVPLIHAGLAELDARARVADDRDTFAALTSAQQVALMRSMENDHFFAVARKLVVMGTLAEPSYGGNRGHAGWAMIGMDHQPSYTAPFGWYDAHAAADMTRAQ
jgi:gluconate 2-dehydrogenase gamma chain